MSQAQSLSLGIVGLGQCGGNIASEFKVMGYPVLAINTSEADLRSIAHLSDDEKLFVGTPGMNGTGHDRGVGLSCLNQNTQAIHEIVNKKLSDASYLMVVAGLGGGTGGNIAEVVEQLSTLGKPIVALSILPSRSETHEAKVNALQALNGLLDTDFASMLIVDNQKLIASFATSGLDQFFTKANEALVSLIHELNTLPTSSDLTSISSFDSRELSAVFLSGGITVLSADDLDGSLDKGLLMDQLKKQTSENSIFAGAFDLEEAMVLASVLVAPQNVLSNMPANELEGFLTEVKSITGGATHYNGIYAADRHGPRLFIVVGGLPLPTRTSELLTEATEEAARFSTKKEPKKRLKKLDLSALGISAPAAKKGRSSGKGMAKHGAKAKEEASVEDFELDGPIVEEMVEEEVVNLDESWEDESR